MYLVVFEVSILKIPLQDALEKRFAEIKEKERTISKQNEIIEAMEKANSNLNDECLKGKEIISQNKVSVNSKAKLLF